MRVLHLMEYYAAVGGLERGVHMICDILEEAGHACAAVFSHAGEGERPARRPAHYVPELAEPHGSRAIASLQRVLEKEQPDVVLIHEFLEPEILEWVVARYPSIRYVWGFKLMCPGGRRMWEEPGEVCSRKVGYLCQAVAYREHCMPRDPRQGLPLIARTMRLAEIHRARSEMVVPSEFMKRLLIREQFDPDRVHCLPLCTVLPPAQNLTASQDPHLIFCAARLRHEKGVHLLVEAMETLPHARLVIAGDGPERPSLEAHVRREGLAGRVTFAGWIGSSEVARYMAQAAIVVVPSIWPEPFGMVGIEAMAYGRPVVAFDVGGISEWLVPGETGALVPPADVAGLRQSLAQLMDNQETAAQMGRKGRAVVEQRFTAEAYRDALLPVLSRARDARRAV
jgi:glycosyltransferase involved in cell wall biosynthesis